VKDSKENKKLKEKIFSLLALMEEQQASDLFITAGLPPTFKIHGKTTPVTSENFTSDQVSLVAMMLMDERHKKEFATTLECNFAFDMNDTGRFRINVFQQKNQVGMVIRRIKTDIPKISELHLPDIIPELALAKRGLIIVVGPTGTGKSTTLAAMIGYRNERKHGHIITIEDPIEFIHEHGLGVITQREIGVDTLSYEAALSNALRQAPDVILIGEIRSQETMLQAIAFAETGHLCLATLHANNSNQTLDRIVNFFPENRHKQILQDLSINLNCIVAQRLIVNKDLSSRALAVEVLLNTPLISELIHKGEFEKLKSVMKKSGPLGMQTFDQAIYTLYDNGKITRENALAHADESNNLRLMIKLTAEEEPEDKKSKVQNMSLLDRKNIPQ